MVNSLQANVEKLKQNISSYQNDLVTLKARAKTAAATKKINEQISRIDSSGTLTMLDRMREKVEAEESLATAYGELATPEASIDDEINKALTSPDTKLLQADDSLAALKAKMGPVRRSCARGRLTTAGTRSSAEAPDGGSESASAANSPHALDPNRLAKATENAGAHRSTPSRAGPCVGWPKLGSNGPQSGRGKQRTRPARAPGRHRYWPWP